MNFKGTVTNVGEVVNGTSKSGKPYSRQQYVLTYDDTKPEWPKAVVFDVMNDNIGKFNLQLNGEYEVEVDFSVREWQGKHYQSASCWKATPLNTANAAPQTQYQQPAQQPGHTNPPQTDDLPF